MICYLVRHGKDDDSIRGGWSEALLTAEGLSQAAALARHIGKYRDQLAIKNLYASDLARAKETARPIAEELGLSVTLLPGFREVNNGKLAGMDNELAKAQYPGLFWNALEWEQKYPDGESPKDFYERVKTAWEQFTVCLSEKDENSILVTHGGVINVIMSLVHCVPYSNKDKPRKIPHATLIALALVNGEWRECDGEKG